MRLILTTRCGCSRTVHVAGETPPRVYTAPLRPYPSELARVYDAQPPEPVQTRDFLLWARAKTGPWAEPAYEYREK